MPKRLGELDGCRADPATGTSHENRLIRRERPELKQRLPRCQVNKAGTARLLIAPALRKRGKASDRHRYLLREGAGKINAGIATEDEAHIARAKVGDAGSD